MGQGLLLVEKWSKRSSRTEQKNRESLPGIDPMLEHPPVCDKFSMRRQSEPWLRTKRESLRTSALHFQWEYFKRQRKRNELNENNEWLDCPYSPKEKSFRQNQHHKRKPKKPTQKNLN